MDHDSLFLSLLASLTGGALPPLPQNPAVWEEVFLSARRHRVEAALCDTVSDSPAFLALPASFREKLLSDARIAVAAQARRSDRFASLCRRFDGEGLHPLVLKGMACRVLWRNPDARPSGDEDLLIPPGELDRYFPLLREEGFVIGGEREECLCLSPADGLRLELHTRPFPTDSRYFSEFNRPFGSVFETAVGFQALGTRFSTPCPTLALLYLFLHALKHFIHSGVGIRQLCDISLYAARFGKDADWHSVRRKLERVGADVWYATLLLLLRDRLSLDPGKAGIPPEHFDGAADPQPLLEDILSGAIFGAHDMARHHSGTLTREAVEGNGSALLRTLFPSAAVMSRRYPYLKKHPGLLPAAWVGRLARYGRETGRTASGSLSISRRRVGLLRSYGIPKKAKQTKTPSGRSR